MCWLQEGAAETSDSTLLPPPAERSGLRKTDAGVSRGTLRPRNRPAPMPPGKTPADSAAAAGMLRWSGDSQLTSIISPLDLEEPTVPRPPEGHESSSKPPPPVAEKPKKRKQQHSLSRDQSHDQSHDIPDGIPGDELDQLVLTASGSEVAGRKGKVKAQSSRADMSDSIVEGLLKQAEGRGRCVCV